MKKIRLITFHTPKNYGAVLQAYSLMSFLQNYSNDVAIIDFNTKHLRRMYSVFPRVNSVKSFLTLLYLFPTYYPKHVKFRRFEKFVKKHLILTDRYESFAELENAMKTEGVDIFITGSDQVFNPNRIEEERKAFFLSFVAPNKNKVSYAGSFGCKEIPIERKEEILGYLKGYKGISVREESGVKLLKNTYGIDAVCVVDPVLLNNRNFWTSICIPYKKRNISNYFLFYRLMNDKVIDERVSELAREKGLELVVITDGLCRIKGAKILRDVGPCEFLALYKDSRFVATDSFHGVVFSIVFQKQFVFVDTRENTNNRGLELLKKLQIDDKAYIENRFSEINYEEVSPLLNSMISISKQYIEGCIK